MRLNRIILLLILVTGVEFCSKKHETTLYFRYPEDVSITIDVPKMELRKPTLLIFYALPNGNSTAWTMGKQLEESDDWHYNIQHISAQTRFLRQQIKDRNIVVTYLENDLKSWPAWRRNHPDNSELIHSIVDTVASLFPQDNLKIALNGHSGGGSFIFCYLNGTDTIPNNIERISFIDSNYGYEDTLGHGEKMASWLKESDNHYLTVYAYNDSIALYNGKPFVSATGGTWYRSKMMLYKLEQSFDFTVDDQDSLIWYNALDNRIQIILKRNLDRGIYHTQQVERNGFIHSILSGTSLQEKGYHYYGNRSYASFIKD